MKYYIKTNENNRVIMLMTETHRMVGDVKTVEIDDAQYDVITKELSCYETVKNENGEYVLNYIPRSEEELLAEQLEQEQAVIAGLRKKRERECFAVINRGVIWYDTLSVSQKSDLSSWYNAWLDITETKVIPEKPEWLE